MEKLIVKGGIPLKGFVNISGSKNSSLPILAAALLTDEPVIIRRVPDVSDTNYMIQILGKLGAEVERSSGTVRIHAQDIHHKASYDQVRKMRASICLLGPLMGRLNRCLIALPGGCVIGDRPVDLHIKAIEALGAKVEFERGDLLISAEEGLQGNEVDLRGEHGPTVLGTDNLLMAAVLAKGTTVIESAACEPEVEDLANFLVKMGARIEGIGTCKMTVHGVKKLHGCEHTVIPDRIEAGTFMVAAAMVGEGVTIRRIRRDHLKPISKMLQDCGHQLEFTEKGDAVTIYRQEEGGCCDITTAPYPGFPTDMQAQMTALFSLSQGRSVIKDTIFPQRFMHCAELKRMGASIKVDNGTAVIQGQGAGSLSGAPVMASDLRASAALVLAALAAHGETEITRLYHIDRGYEQIDDKLSMIGAAVERVSYEEEA